MALAVVVMLAVVVGGLYWLGETLREYRCDASGTDPRCGPVLSAEAFEECRGWSLDAMAREFGTAVDPYAVARAFSWEAKERQGDLGVYWGCLNGFGITWERGIDIEPPDWAPPPRFATPH